MSKKNQMGGEIIATKPATQKSLDNRSSQLNPNNSKYADSREKSNAKVSTGTEDYSDWGEDSFGDDWEFNYD